MTHWKGRVSLRDDTERDEQRCRPDERGIDEIVEDDDDDDAVMPLPEHQTDLIIELKDQGWIGLREKGEIHSIDPTGIGWITCANTACPIMASAENVTTLKLKPGDSVEFIISIKEKLSYPIAAALMRPPDGKPRDDK